MSDTVRFTGGGLTFEWDAAEAATNRRKHRVGFEEAATVFLDPLARLFDGSDTTHGEMRWLIVGLPVAQRAVLVVHVERALAASAPRGATC